MQTEKKLILNDAIAKADPPPAHRARAPYLKCFKGLILRVYFENFDCRTHIDFIVMNMQSLQCVFYSLLSLQKRRVCVKGHQINLQT